jgi:hypothetical protein
MKSSKPSDENINVKSNWDLNLTPLIPINIESKFTKISYYGVHDIVLEMKIQMMILIISFVKCL